MIAGKTAVALSLKPALFCKASLSIREADGVALIHDP